jgi:hypothetical protein
VKQFTEAGIFWCGGRADKTLKSAARGALAAAGHAGFDRISQH